MLTFPHSLVALAIFKLFPPGSAFFLAFISHFVLDFCVPHWNPHFYTEFHQDKKVSTPSIKIAFIDSLASGFLTLFFVLQAFPNWSKMAGYILVVFFALLPDLIEIPYYFFGCQQKWLKTYVRFEHQHQASANVFWGSLTQVVTILAAIRLLLL